MEKQGAGGGTLISDLCKSNRPEESQEGTQQNNHHIIFRCLPARPTHRLALCVFEPKLGHEGVPAASGHGQSGEVPEGHERLADTRTPEQVRCEEVDPTPRVHERGYPAPELLHLLFG